jgi:hypothetical protein
MGIISIVEGWVISIMWRWFVAPVTGWPAISIWTAAGLSLLIGIVRYDPFRAVREHHENDVEDYIAAAIFLVMTDLLGLGIGWIFLQLNT